jgi:hypothetical protein
MRRVFLMSVALSAAYSAAVASANSAALEVLPKGDLFAGWSGARHKSKRKPDKGKKRRNMLHVSKRTRRKHKRAA